MESQPGLTNACASLQGEGLISASEALTEDAEASGVRSEDDNDDTAPGAGMSKFRVIAAGSRSADGDRNSSSGKGSDSEAQADRKRRQKGSGGCFGEQIGIIWMGMGWRLNKPPRGALRERKSWMPK